MSVNIIKPYKVFLLTRIARMQANFHELSFVAIRLHSRNSCLLFIKLFLNFFLQVLLEVVIKFSTGLRGVSKKLPNHFIYRPALFAVYPAKRTAN